MSEILDPLHWVSGLIPVVILLIGLVIIDIPRDKYRVRKLEQQVTQLEQLVSSYIEETSSTSGQVTPPSPPGCSHRTGTGPGMAEFLVGAMTGMAVVFVLVVSLDLWR